MKYGATNSIHLTSRTNAPNNTEIQSKSEQLVAACNAEAATVVRWYVRYRYRTGVLRQLRPRDKPTVLQRTVGFSILYYLAVLRSGDFKMSFGIVRAATVLSSWESKSFSRTNLTFYLLDSHCLSRRKVYNYAHNACTTFLATANRQLASIMHYAIPPSLTSPQLPPCNGQGAVGLNILEVIPM